jgi:predicted solute-binding protein
MAPVSILSFLAARKYFPLHKTVGIVANEIIMAVRFVNYFKPFTTVWTNDIASQ